MKKKSFFLSENFQFLEVKFSIYLKGLDFLMELKEKKRKNNKVIGERKFKHWLYWQSHFVYFMNFCGVIKSSYGNINKYYLQQYFLCICVY